MSESLEFHYVVSYREGIGWDVSPDTEAAKFPDGTIYDWDKNEWIASWTDSEDEKESLLDEIDLHHYRMLKYAIAQINNHRIEQLMEETNA
jgi:hypothetical protein